MLFDPLTLSVPVERDAYIPPPLDCAVHDVNVVSPMMERVFVVSDACIPPPSMDALHDLKDVELSVSVDVIYIPPPSFASQKSKLQLVTLTLPSLYIAPPFPSGVVHEVKET